MKEVSKNKKILEWASSFFIALLLALLLIVFVVFTANVPTSSMEPTIMAGDKIIVWKFFRYFDWEHRGLTHRDIVVFKYTDDLITEEKLLVKRVIGLGGDEISITDGVVYRNGIELDEPYVKNKDTKNFGSFVVPEGEMFVMGDNRLNSYDSRYWEKHTVSLDKVIGELK